MERSNAEMSTERAPTTQRTRAGARRIAGAPISWGVCEVPGWGAQLPPERVLAEMAALGIAATELGPAGWLGADPAARLGEYGLALVGGFVPLVLHAGEPDVDAAARTLAAAGADVFVAALVMDADWSRPEPLDDERFATLVANLAEAERRVAAHGLTFALHPHAGTLAETSADVARLLAVSDVGWCLDTGHLLLGGADPVAFARDHGDRVVHVHLKDVDAAVAARYRAGELDLVGATRAGLFRPLGQGDARIAEVLAALDAHGYDGWHVLEQDVTLEAAPAGGSGPAGDVAASFAYLRPAAPAGGDRVGAPAGSPAVVPRARRRIGVGVIGFGWLGRAHARSLARIPMLFADRGYDPVLVACADPAPGAADAAADAFGFTRAGADWRAVIDDPGVDAVWIAAPNRLHAELVTAAAEAGKHVFCEKPVGGTPAETRRAAAAVARAGVTGGVGFNYRWAPLVRHAAELIAAGELGALTNVRGCFFSGYGADPLGVLSWRYRLDEGGHGASSDLLSHAVDLAHFLAGPITRVVGTTATTIDRRPLGAGSHYGRGTADDAHGDVTNEDYAGLLCEFANGARGSFEASRAIVGPESRLAIDVHGTRGAVGWDFEAMNELRVLPPGGRRLQPRARRRAPSTARRVRPGQRERHRLRGPRDDRGRRVLRRDRGGAAVHAGLRRRARVGGRPGRAPAQPRLRALGGRVSVTAVAPLRIGVIGVGRIGRLHATLLAGRVPGAAVAGVFDAHGEVGRERRRRTGRPRRGERRGADRGRRRDRDLLEHRHARRPPRGGRRGRAAVFCEKPVSLDLAEVDRALAAVDAAGVPFQVGFNRRFDPAHRSVRDAVASGTIGTPHLVRISSRDAEPPPPAYVRVSGGLFLDMTIHDFDMARFVTGTEVVEVFARGSVRVDPDFAAAGDVDTALVTLVHEDGCLTAIDNSRRAAYGYDQRVEAFGDGGMAASDNPPAHAGVVHTAAGRHAPGAHPLVPRSLRRELRARVGRVRRRDPVGRAAAAHDGRRAGAADDRAGRLALAARGPSGTGRGDARVRLTVAQALVRFLAVQYVERDGERRRFFAGCLGIFGHGNVAGLGQALQQHHDLLPYLPAAQRAGDGPPGLRLRAPVEPAARVRVHVVGRAGRHEHGHRRRARHGQPAARAPAPRRHVRGPRPAPGAPAARGAARRHGLGQRLLPAGDPLLRPHHAARAARRRRARGVARAHRPGGDRRGLPRAARGRPDRGRRRPGRVPRGADVDELPAAAARRGARPRGGAVRGARRPLVVAGGGVVYAEATGALRALADATGIPVAETQAGRGALPSAHPSALGAVGATGTPAANGLAAEADLVIGVGTRWSDFTTASKSAFQDPGVALRQRQRRRARRRQARAASPSRPTRGSRSTRCATQLAGHRADRPWARARREAAAAWDADVARALRRRPRPAAQPGGGDRRGQRRGGRARRRGLRGRLDARRPAQAVARHRPRRQGLPRRVRLLVHGLRARRGRWASSSPRPTGRCSRWSATART